MALCEWPPLQGRCSASLLSLQNRTNVLMYIHLPETLSVEGISLPDPDRSSVMPPARQGNTIA